MCYRPVPLPGSRPTSMLACFNSGGSSREGQPFSRSSLVQITSAVPRSGLRTAPRPVAEGRFLFLAAPHDRRVVADDERIGQVPDRTSSGSDKSSPARNTTPPVRPGKPAHVCSPEAVRTPPRLHKTGCRDQIPPGDLDIPWCVTCGPTSRSFRRMSDPAPPLPQPDAVGVDPWTCVRTDGKHGAGEGT